MAKQEFEGKLPGQENKLPKGELEIAATELTKIFENRLKNSEMNLALNEGGDVNIPTEFISTPVYEPRWSVGVYKGKVEIRRITTQSWIGDRAGKKTDEKITITTGILPTVKYEFQNKDNTGEKPKIFGGQYENTRRAVAKCEEVINAIPQTPRTQKTPLR